MATDPQLNKPLSCNRSVGMVIGNRFIGVQTVDLATVATITGPTKNHHASRTDA